MAEKVRQIIAIGGGGFSAGAGGLAIDRYVVAQTGKASPVVAFVGTASGDDPRYIVRFYRAFSSLGCRPSHLPLFERTPDLRSFLLSQDVIYVGGGNTKSMLAVWRDWGLPELLHEAYDAGVVLAGTSAGGMCWFEQAITDSFGDRYRALPCLGFLPGSCCPHFDTEAERRPTLHELLLKGAIKPGIALDDAAAAHFVDGELHQVIASSPTARAYRLSVGGGAVSEEPITPVVVGLST